MVLALDLSELEKFKNGDEAIVDRVLAALKKRLYNTACRIVDDPVDAEDIVAETIEELWNYRAKIVSARHIVNYAYKVASHKAQAFAEKYPGRLTPDYHTSSSLLTDPHMAMLEDEFTEQVVHWAGRARTIINQMPYKWAQVLLLHLDGKSNETIAEELDITTYTVRNHLVRAKTNISQLLMDEGFPRDLLLLILACYLS